MALFPLFVNLENKNVLIVGGGKVALRKLEKLIPFNPNLKVVAKDFEKDLLNILEIHSIKFEKKEFDFEDLKGIDIVVVAVDDISLQEKIYQYTRGKNILVNSVDSPDFCDFIFPAYVKKGDLVIGVSTSGKVPGLSGRIREKIEECLPEDIDRLLEEIYQIRTSLPKGKERQKKILNLIEKIL